MTVQYILRKVGMALLTILATSVLTFCLLRAMPGDVFYNQARDLSRASGIPLADAYRQITERYNYDPEEPLISQMARYYGSLLKGNLGTSMINQSMTVDFFMKKENLITFRLNDYTDEIKEIMSSKRYRDFPILDKNGGYIGMISRRNLLGVRKRAVILVDHNEITQAVDNVQDAEILEIIDHHRLGSLETIAPVYFRNQPVGCTATIIYQLYQERQAEIPRHIAGLLCAAILSDTLIFRSPTCTYADRAAAEALSKIAGIKCEEFAKEMFAAGSDLKNKTPEEIFYQDFKKFEFGDKKLGIGHITSMSQKELDDIKQRMVPFLQKAYKEHGLDTMIFMLTNIMEESTEMLCHGENASELVEAAFPVKVVNNAAIVPAVVSRKKQVVPALMAALNRSSEV